MGHFEYGPVSASDATEFTTWTRGLSGELRRLTSAGEVTPIPHLDDLLSIYDKVVHETETAARQAGGGGQIPRITVPMTPLEYRRLHDIGRAIESYVEILATKGKISLDMTAGQAAAFDALAAGTYID